MELMQASRQWASRPHDERFTSLTALAAFVGYQRQNSGRAVVTNRKLTVVPATDGNDIALQFTAGRVAEPRLASFTHWSFQQLASLSGVPAGYIRDSEMPAPLAADNLNWGLHYHRDVEDVSILMRQNGHIELGAVNGPNYGAVWNASIADALLKSFGNGVDGHWRIPGEFGHKVTPTKENTTLYASDRDMWVFLADEERRIEMPDRRAGRSGSFARGFFVSNSETGAGKLRFGSFMFDYVCCNRIIWGARDYDEVAIRHSKGAPQRWIEEVAPIIKQLADASPAPIREAIAAAKAHSLADKTRDFLASRFGTRTLADKIMQAHEVDECRPIENVWDAVVGATAYARLIPYQDERVQLERKAGELLKLAA